MYGCSWKSHGGAASSYCNACSTSTGAPNQAAAVWYGWVCLQQCSVVRSAVERISALGCLCSKVSVHSVSPYPCPMLCCALSRIVLMPDSKKTTLWRVHKGHRPVVPARCVLPVDAFCWLLRACLASLVSGRDSARFTAFCQGCTSQGSTSTTCQQYLQGEQATSACDKDVWFKHTVLQPRRTSSGSCVPFRVAWEGTPQTVGLFLAHKDYTALQRLFGINKANFHGRHNDLPSHQTLQMVASSCSSDRQLPVP